MSARRSPPPRLRRTDRKTGVSSAQGMTSLCGVRGRAPAIVAVWAVATGPPFTFGARYDRGATQSCLEQIMSKGTVKWFNPTKGYGFIQPQGGGGKDVFVHISAVERAGLSSLNEGQVVEYEEVSNRGKTSAENLKVQR